MRVEAGIRRTGHWHGDTEEVFVLEGDLQLGPVQLRPGDYSGASRGTLHPETRTESGCLCLCFAGQMNHPRWVPDTARPRAGQVIVRAEEGAWRAAGHGLQTKPLFTDRRTGSATALVRIETGATLRPPLAAVTEIFVLRGRGRIAGHVLSTGDYCRAAPGLARDVGSAEPGCVVLMATSGVGHP
jgi:hypothetical protein